MSKENLTEELKKGDLKSFRVLVDEHQRKVLNTCYRFVGSREDAEDLTQEVFLEVYIATKNVQLHVQVYHLKHPNPILQK